MKKTILCIIGLIATISSFAQTADDIVNKYLDAIGGKEKLLAIKNIYMEGTVDANGQQITVKVWMMNKAAVRQEMTFSGMTGYTIVTKDSGWNFSPFEGQKTAEPMTADMVKKAQPSLDIQSPLLNYKDKGYKLSFKGKDDVDGSDAYKLELMINDSTSETYFIDPSSYYIMRKKTKGKANGKEEEETTDYSNYQKTPDGYTFAMTEGSGDQGQIKFTVLKINTDMDPGLFKPKR
jgi:hypothetical protein